MNGIQNLIPKNKFDNSNIETLKAIDADEAEPILGRLLEWIQDINWPVAQELFRVLPRFHNELIPHIKAVFESEDNIWKNWVLCLIKEFPEESVVLLMPDIKRISEQPTAGEIEEGTDIFAAKVIGMFGAEFQKNRNASVTKN